jgi:hypothetical protein
MVFYFLFENFIIVIFSTIFPQCKHKIDCKSTVLTFQSSTFPVAKAEVNVNYFHFVYFLIWPPPPPLPPPQQILSQARNKFHFLRGRRGELRFVAGKLSGNYDATNVAKKKS